MTEKEILIVEAVKCCIDCREAMYRFDDLSGEIEFTICTAMDGEYGCGKGFSFDELSPSEGRPKWCPRRKMPKKRVREYLPSDFDEGWDACICAITGREKLEE